MKRFIAVLSFALAVPAAFAAGAPFEQVNLDRALPNVPEKARTAPVSVRETPDYNFIAPAQ